MATSATIAASVHEVHGDSAARANCVLSVDGVVVDKAVGIAVDRGDFVSCLFVHEFDSVGRRVVKVSVEGVAPADDDASNDALTETVEVHDRASMLHHAAAARTESQWHFRQVGTYGAATTGAQRDWEVTYDSRGTVEQAQMQFSDDRALAGAPTIEVSERSSDAPAATARNVRD